MAWQLQATIFGKAIRLASNNKFFQYPDEIDQLLWKGAVQLDSPEQTAVSPGESDRDARNDSVQNRVLQYDGKTEGGQSILLVSWYGPDDPEV